MEISAVILPLKTWFLFCGHMQNSNNILCNRRTVTIVRRAIFAEFDLWPQRQAPLITILPLSLRLLLFFLGGWGGAQSRTVVTFYAIREHLHLLQQQFWPYTLTLDSTRSYANSCCNSAIIQSMIVFCLFESTQNNCNILCNKGQIQLFFIEYFIQWYGFTGS